MAVIPLKGRNITIENCLVCGKWYESGASEVGVSYTVSCTVLHPPGSCCHFNERPLTEEQVTEILLITQKS